MYSIVFSLITNWYLCSDFENLFFNQKYFFLHLLAHCSHVTFPTQPHVMSTCSSQLLEICQLNTSSTFNSSLFSYVVSSRDCNVMVTRPTNHMILTRDHSHDLLTWSRHVTTHMICSHDLDTWPTNFILTSSHHRYHHPRHHLHVMTTSGSLIRHTTTTSPHYHGMHRLSSKDLVWASSGML